MVFYIFCVFLDFKPSMGCGRSSHVDPPGTTPHVAAKSGARAARCSAAADAGAMDRWGQGLWDSGDPAMWGLHTLLGIYLPGKCQGIEPRKTGIYPTN